MLNSSNSIKVEGFVNPQSFVDKWSPTYEYPNESKYLKNIENSLESKDSFYELFRWKNGTGNRIAKNKLKLVDKFWSKINNLRNLKENFDWDEYENIFEPHKSSTIWSVFLLHLIDNSRFPIYDQHVYRFFNFHKEGIIKEMTSSSSKSYKFYKNEYHPWFNKVRESYNLNPKKMDESFFQFGRFLKDINNYPIEVY